MVVGYTHASNVIPLVNCSEAALLTVTSALVPLKLKALPYLPDAVQVAPLIVPLLPLPDTSATTVPLPSLNPYAATKPGLGVGVAVGVGVGVGVGVTVGVGVAAGVGVAVGNGVGVGVGVAVGVGVGVGVATGVPVGVGVGVADGQDSLPMVINVPGEFWLLYSVVIQAAERAVADIRTSSMSPLHGLLPRAPLPISASGTLEVVGVAAVGPATSEPFLYKRRLLPSNVPTMCWRLLVSSVAA